MGVIVIATITFLSTGNYYQFQVDSINYADKEIEYLESKGYDIITQYEHIRYVIPRLRPPYSGK